MNQFAQLVAIGHGTKSANACSINVIFLVCFELSNLDHMYIASNLEQIYDWWVGKNLNGRDRGLLKALPWSWPWMVEETHEQSHAHFPITWSGLEWNLSRIQIQRITATAVVSVYCSVIAPSGRSKAHRKQSRLALRIQNIDSFPMCNLLHVSTNRLRQ